MQILASDKNCLLPKDYICGLCESSFKWVLYTLSPSSSCGIIMDFQILFLINFFLKNNNNNNKNLTFFNSNEENLVMRIVKESSTSQS